MTDLNIIPSLRQFVFTAISKHKSENKEGRFLLLPSGRQKLRSTLFSLSLFLCLSFFHDARSLIVSKVLIKCGSKLRD